MPYSATGQARPEQSPQLKTVDLLGTVLGLEGQPAPGADIGVIDPAKGPLRLDRLLTTKCGAAGEFELTATDLSEWYGPRATYVVVARSGDGTLVGVALVAASDAGKPVEVRLQAAAYIHSSVLDPNGKPLPGVGTGLAVTSGYMTVRADGPRTTESGEVRLGPLPAGLPLRVSVAHELQHLVPQDTWRRVPITLQPGETCELPPLVMDPEGRSVEGTLEDAEGRSLAGAQVVCYLPGWPLNVATTDERGRFRLTRLPVKGYDVWLMAADTAKQLYVMSPVDPDSGETVRLVLCPLTSASGLLIGQDGQVLADIPVRLVPMLKAQRESVTSYTVWDAEWVRTPQPANTAEDGSWQIDGLIPGGMYSVRAEGPNARLDFRDSFIEVDREGKPTDIGLMTTH
jgi:hypothetical protein